MKQISVRIEGTSCQRCVEAVRDALQSLEGVQVTLTMPCTALLQFNQERHAVDEVLDSIRHEGFSLSTRSASEEQVA